MQNKTTQLLSIVPLTLLSLCSFSSLAAKEVIEPQMVVIPSGTFSMGSATGRKSERPVHQVSIKQFAMAKHEVTIKEFRQFTQVTGYEATSGDKNCITWQRKTEENKGEGLIFNDTNWHNNPLTPSEFHPVLCVSSVDVAAYINWLNAETGKQYRLPSEAEWEYAARAGSNHKYFFGDNVQDLCRYGNVFDQRGQLAFIEDYATDDVTFAQCDDKSAFTSIVGMYQPNAFGLFDTIGNVGEILADCEHTSYAGAPSDGSPWITQCDKFRDSEMKIRRGGAYGAWSIPRSIRSASRHHIGLSMRSSLGEGFRLARSINKNEDLTPSNATTQFNQALVQAQNTESQHRLTLVPFPNKPAAVTINKKSDTNRYQISWEQPQSIDTTRYNIYRSDSFGGRYTLLAQDVKETSFTDSPDQDRRHRYVISAVEGNKESAYSLAVKTEQVIKSIKSVVQAEDYNYMQGIEVGIVRPNEEPEEGFNLTGNGGINKGNWTEYLIDVKENGYYKVNYRVASADGSAGFNLIFNDTVTATLPVPPTGGWRKWQTESGGKIYIKAGQYKVRMQAIASGWKLNWFSFESV